MNATEKFTEVMRAAAVLANLEPWHTCGTCAYCIAMAILRKHAARWPFNNDEEHT